jgi:uncharacterized protein (TIGR02145 family)
MNSYAWFWSAKMHNSTASWSPYLHYSLTSLGEQSVDNKYGFSVRCVRDKQFVCGQPVVDARDNKSYNTIKIGTQCWMRENLNIGTRIAIGQDQANNGIIEKYCYNDNEDTCDTYGGLYQWDEVMQYILNQGIRGICPHGWYVPTDADWTALTTYLGGESVAGGPLKEAGTAHWSSPNTSATNSTGFTALPGGYRTTTPYFANIKTSGVWWTSSAYVSNNRWFRTMYYQSQAVNRSDIHKSNGLSVRCIKEL